MSGDFGESSPKQTLSFLLQRFKNSGIHPRSQLGQNFLIDMNLQRVLLETAKLTPDDVVLEVGTGTGALTALIAPQVAAIITVEMDRDLYQLASEELFGCPNVIMLEGDALQSKSRIRADVLEAVYTQLDAAPSRQFKLVANLPYNIATPLLSNLLALPRPPQSMTCTIQKEMADRIVALPDTKDYGSLAIWIQSQCRAEIVRILGPSVFWPRPKVSSAFVQIVPDAERLRKIPDRGFFHAFVRSMFTHRRKLLRFEILNAYKNLSKSDADKLLVDLGIAPTARAEQLGVETMLALSEAIRTHPASDQS